MNSPRGEKAMSEQLAANRPTIKILLYTDDPQVSPTDHLGEFLGLGSMIERLNQHAPTFADLNIKWISRSTDSSSHANNRIDDVLAQEAQTGEPFDEIWFFGLHQANTEKFSLGAFRGGPNSELDAAEVAALQQWMGTENGFHGGGVLMTGDHANASPPKLLATPNSPCGDTSASADFLGLGRAIGRCVPRAGLLRRWEGPPTHRDQDSFNTIGKSGFQVDRIPQTLHLRKLNLDGDPDNSGMPHPLFFYGPEQFIEAFPDHQHEGAVILPSDFAGWPIGPKGQTQPHVVATGIDPRNDQPLNILATYNGDLTGVGRIVSDSTWHHYMNLNLRGFPHPAPKGSPSDQIGQFYGNLAIWLAPRNKRIQMARAMCWQLARFTLLLQERSDPETIGNFAHSVLGESTSPCEIHELLQVLPPLESGGFPAATLPGSNDQPSRELFLGVVLDAYHQTMIQAETENQLAANGPQENSVDKLIEVCFRRTFDEHEKRLRRDLEAIVNKKTK
jgi:hypothetical protein